MLLGLLLTGTLPTASAADVWIDVPFTAPEGTPLFVTAEVLTTRGTVKADDCMGAARQALELAEEKGRILRVVIAVDDLKSAAKAPCRRRQAGDEITASVVTLTSLVVSPGAPPAVFPEVTTQRALQITALLSVMASENRMAPIHNIEGKAWVRLEQKVLDDTLDLVRYTARERGRKAFDRVVRPWIVQWVQVVEGLPEVHGAVMEVDVPVEDPNKGRKGRRTERYRFAVPTKAASRFDNGDLLAEELMAFIRVDYIADIKDSGYKLIALTDEAEAVQEKQVSPQRDRALPTMDDNIPDEAP